MGDSWYSGSITDTHINALNYLLHVQTGDADRRAMSCYVLYMESCHTFGGQTLWDVPWPALPLVQEMPELEAVQRNLRKLLEAVRHLRRSVGDFQVALKQRMDTARGARESESIGLAFLRTKEWVRQLRSLSLCIDELSSDRQQSATGFGDEGLYELAESISKLINLKDKPYRDRRAKEIARHRMEKPSVHGVRASTRDVEAARWEITRQAFPLIEAINRHLDHAGIGMWLSPDHLSRPGVLVECATREGIRPRGLFAVVLVPFIQYLCAPAPKRCLAVCANVSCKAVFARDTRPTSRFCSRKCGRRALVDE